jgi:hypothetical protein
MWNDPPRAQALGKERALLEKIVLGLDAMDNTLLDGTELLEMAREEQDEDTLAAVAEDLAGVEKLVAHVPALGGAQGMVVRIDRSFSRRCRRHQKRHHPHPGRVRIRLVQN